MSLATLSPERAKEFADPNTKMAIGCPQRFRILSKSADDTPTEVMVKGFASIIGTDRDGDNIDPALFDIQAYMKNPIVYWNHKPWKTAEGNEVSIGTTEKMFSVVVKQNADDVSKFDLTDEASGNIIDTIDSEEFLVKDGDRGLWVHIKIIEPEVAKMVVDGRANAFSFKGALRKSHVTGKLSIDIFEVSLVTVPAQSRSLFALAKSLDALNGMMVTVTSDCKDAWLLWDNAFLVKTDTEPRYAIAFRDDVYNEVVFFPNSVVRTVDEARAVAEALTSKAISDRSVVLLKPTGQRTMSGSDVYEAEVIETIADGTPDASLQKDAGVQTEQERSLFKLLANVKVAAANEVTKAQGDDTSAQTDGSEGGDEMNEEILKAIQGVGDQVKGISTGMETLEKRIGALEIAREAQAANANANAAAAPAGDAPVVKAEGSEDASAAPAEPAKPEATDLEKQVLEALGTITKEIKGVSDKQDAFEKRLAKIETTPVASHAADDSSGADEANLVKSYNGLDAASKSQVHRAHLGFRMIPDMTAKR